MKISVIIPIYKPQSYLWKCLDSLVKQTFPKEDFEIILVLNGCNEPYKGEIERYISTKMQRMNVNFIHTEQGGVSNARNIALDNVKGEYVTFIDDDDFVSETFLEGLYKKVSPKIISLCRPVSFIDKTNEIISCGISKLYENRKDKGIQCLSKARKYFSGPCMKLIPMSFIQDRRYNVNFKNGEDTIFMFLISDKIQEVNFTSSDAIYYRRVRRESASTSARTRTEIIKTNLKQIKVYSEIYIPNINRYNFFFFCTRVIACLYAMIRKY